MNLVKLKALFWFLIFFFVGLIFGSLSVVIKFISIFLIFFGSGKVKQYGINVWEGYDNSASAETGGDPDESISSRLGKARQKGSGWSFIANKVDLVAAELFGDINHCEKSIERDEGKKQVTTH